MQLDVVRSGGMDCCAKSLKGAPPTTRGSPPKPLSLKAFASTQWSLRNDRDGGLVLGGRCSLLHAHPGLVRSGWEAGQRVLAEVDHPSLVVRRQEVGFRFAELLSVPEELHEGLGG